eukprot:scaffold7026_cov65-Phaeocystis_antarctica.AAC.3
MPCDARVEQGRSVCECALTRVLREECETFPVFLWSCVESSRGIRGKSSPPPARSGLGFSRRAEYRIRFIRK